MTCQHCNRTIPLNASYIHHTQTGDNFCDDECASDYDAAQRVERVNGEKEEERADQ